MALNMLTTDMSCGCAQPGAREPQLNSLRLLPIGNASPVS